MVDLEPFNVTGKQVKSLLNQTVPGREYTIIESISDLPYGIYMLQFRLKEVNEDLGKT